MTSILLMAFAGLGYFSLVQLKEVNQKSTDISTNWLPSTVSVQRINTLTSDYRIFEISYVYSMDTKSKQEFKKGVQNISNELSVVRAVYESLISSQEEQLIYNKFSSLWKQYTNLSQEIFKLSEEDKLEEAIDLLQNESRNVFDLAAIELLSAVNLNKSAGLEASLEGDKTYSQARDLILFIICIVIMIAGCVCFGIMITIGMQLGKDPGDLIQITSRVIDGDYDIDDKTTNHGVYKHLVTMVATLKHHIDRAEENARVKSDFLANMSHEIRTPMNGILGLLHLLSKTKLDQKQDEYVQKSLYSANHLLRIIDEILDFSKMEAGKLEFESIPFTISSIFKETTDLYAPKAQSKNLNFEVQAGSQPNLNLLGDPLRIKQVLFNLVSNAIKFTDQGKITIEVLCGHPTNNQLSCTFSVKDTGIGLNDKQKKQLFNAFTQADTSTTRKYGGTGLGLAISKKIIESMHGKIWVESIEGQGTTFHFMLNFEVSKEQAKIDNKNENNAKPVNKHNELILLVEDNDINQMIAQELLESVGYAVEIANNGQEALDMLAAKTYDAVLMDIQMPIMDGLTATRKIREMDEFKDLIVIAMSAHAMTGDYEKSIQNGMNDHITKPIDPDKLFLSLEQWLAKRKT